MIKWLRYWLFGQFECSRLIMPVQTLVQHFAPSYKDKKNTSFNTFQQIK